MFYFVAVLAKLIIIPFYIAMKLLHVGYYLLLFVDF